MQVRLDAEGFQFIAAYLDVGPSFAKLLRQRILGSRHISILANVPPGTSKERALRFNVGGLGSRPVAIGSRPARTPTCDDKLTEEAERFLHIHQHGALILWNYVHRPSDRFVREAPLPWFAFREEIYYFVTAERNTEMLVRQAVRRAMSIPHFLIAHVGGPIPFGLVDRAQVTPGNMADLAGYCKVLEVLAYDGEGYVQVEFEDVS